MVATGVILSGIASANDAGWYLTRKSPYEANRELEKRTTNIRDLITDCTERSISLSCHRAGVWLKKHGKNKQGREYIETACTLGRGYSCRIAGMDYLDTLTQMAQQAEINEEELNRFSSASENAKKYFELGCFRHDAKSCNYLKEIPLAPKLKEGFFDRLFKKL